jgi:hypothetical protein
MPSDNVFSGTFNFDGSHGSSITGAITNTHHYGTTGQEDRLPALIAELRRQIIAHEHVLRDGEGLQASVDMLQEQMETGRPAPSRLRALLTSMATMAGNITAVSAAVSAVRDAIG